jgi:hypothetical protein
MVDRVEQERAIAKDFILPARRARFLEVAKAREIEWEGNLTPQKLKRRGKYREMIANLEHWLDPACKQLPITMPDQHPEARSKLAKLGVSASAYVMSEDREIDGRVMDLDEALSYLARSHTHGTLLFWLEHGVIYYEQSELAALTRVVLARGRISEPEGAKSRSPTRACS